jgi:hypothetical protein
LIIIGVTQNADKHYVPDVSLRKIRKGRRKKRRLRNEMDDMEKGYGQDMYGFGDFDQDRRKDCCSVCHVEGHKKNKHDDRRAKGRKKSSVQSRDGGLWRIMYVTFWLICYIFLLYFVYFTFASTNFLYILCHIFNELNLVPNHTTFTLQGDGSGSGVPPPPLSSTGTGSIEHAALLKIMRFDMIFSLL